MNQVTKQETEATRLMEAYDDFIFSAAGKSVVDFDRIASTMAFNAAAACKDAAMSYPRMTVDRTHWLKLARNMECFVY